MKTTTTAPASMISTNTKDGVKRYIILPPGQKRIIEITDAIIVQIKGKNKQYKKLIVTSDKRVSIEYEE